MEPLEFKRNDDHVKTVVRELIADNVNSETKNTKHLLSFRNMQPEMLSKLANALKGVSEMA